MKELLAAGRAGDKLPLPEIIDMHGHLGRYAFHIPDVGPESMVAVMDRVGIRRVVCSHMQTVGSVTVWPWGEAEVRAEVERCLAAGFVGVKVHNSQGFPYTHPSYAPAYELA